MQFKLICEEKYEILFRGRDYFARTKSLAVPDRGYLPDRIWRLPGF